MADFKLLRDKAGSSDWQPWRQPRRSGTGPLHRRDRKFIGVNVAPTCHNACPEPPGEMRSVKQTYPYSNASQRHLRFRSTPRFGTSGGGVKCVLLAQHLKNDQREGEDDRSDE